MNIFSFQTQADFPKEDGEAAALEQRLLAKVTRARASKEPLHRHEDVMADARAIIDSYRNSETNRQS